MNNIWGIIRNNPVVIIIFYDANRGQEIIDVEWTKTKWPLKIIKKCSKKLLCICPAFIFSNEMFENFNVFSTCKS